MITEASRANEAGAGPRQQRPPKAIENYIDAEVAQATALSGVLRRLEDLADRVCGGVPQPTSSSAAKDMPVGIMGSLLPVHDDRGVMLVRMVDALERIEVVL